MSNENDNRFKLIIKKENIELYRKARKIANGDEDVGECERCGEVYIGECECGIKRMAEDYSKGIFSIIDNNKK